MTAETWLRAEIQRVQVKETEAWKSLGRNLHNRKQALTNEQSELQEMEALVSPDNPRRDLSCPQAPPHTTTTLNSSVSSVQVARSRTQDPPVKTLGEGHHNCHLYATSNGIKDHSDVGERHNAKKQTLAAPQAGVVGEKLSDPEIHFRRFKDSYATQVKKAYRDASVHIKKT